jgi:hypothetical protein
VSEVNKTKNTLADWKSFSLNILVGIVGEKRQKCDDFSPSGINALTDLNKKRFSSL